MSFNRKKLVVNSVAVNVGCSCRRLKLTDIFRPKTRRPKPGLNRINKTSSSSLFTKAAAPPDLCNSSTTSSWDNGTGLSLDEEEDESNTTFRTTPHYYSEPDDSNPIISSKKKNVRGYGRIGESLAVMKDSDDPYLDFRHSMLQMILEKEIYSENDLRELLECFLSLNSPYHHDIIVRAFTEIWNGVFSLNSYKPRSRDF